MSTQTLSTAESARIEGVKTSADLVTKGRFFAQEQISSDRVTALGHIRRFVKKAPAATFAFLGGSLNVVVTAIQEADRQIQQSMKNFGGTILGGATSSGFLTDVARSVFVDAAVAEALENEVSEFRSELNDIERAYDTEYTGPLHNAELESFRDGKIYGPLMSEFQTYAKLEKLYAETGILHVRDSGQNAFIYPEKMVSAFQEQFGGAAGTTHHVLVFKNCAEAPEPTMDVRTLEWDTPDPTAGTVAGQPLPAPAYARR